MCKARISQVYCCLVASYVDGVVCNARVGSYETAGNSHLTFSGHYRKITGKFSEFFLERCPGTGDFQKLENGFTN